MKKTLGALALSAGLAMAPVAAMAGSGHLTSNSETDAIVGVAAGAGVGALVAGPVGAIVGGVVGLIVVQH